MPEDFYVLQNDSLKIDNYIFCGTRGWTVPESTSTTDEDEKMLNREMLRLELSLKSAVEKKQADEKIICLIHYPPFNSKIESSIFTNLMEKYGVYACVYGHIHGKNSRGIRLIEKAGIKYYLTSCDKVDNKLVLVDENI